ncbi:hypothetical protein AC579_1967 [Pseudocercospora musae]|uniref:Uncharacterized protein n=1 Tax=Pseudocercospora musae TaxID=113226 RepID=A0A139I898_9PEZI|nr:hypothetical protein AC579_1967 [Pseudocercospora musae]
MFRSETNETKVNAALMDRQAIESVTKRGYHRQKEIHQPGGIGRVMLQSEHRAPQQSSICVQH